MEARGRASRAAASLLTAGSLIITVGCAESSPAASPSPSPTPSTVSNGPDVAVSTGPTPPTLPESATRETAEGASEFARHYWELADYALASGQVSSLRDAAEPDCVSCLELVAEIEDAFSSGGRLEGGSIIVREASTTPGDSQAGLTTRVLIDQEPITTVSVDGEEQSRTDGSTGLLLEMLLRWSDSEWHVWEWAADDGQ